MSTYSSAAAGCWLLQDSETANQVQGCDDGTDVDDDADDVGGDDGNVGDGDVEDADEV